jgi:phenylacetate-CoA ligase
MGLELAVGVRRLLRDNWMCRRRVRKLRSHESFSIDEIEAFTRAALHRTLISAAERLPYYRRAPRRFPPSCALEVLHDNFPIITKSTLLENRGSLYPRAGKARLWESVGKTSGTTGTPLEVIRSPDSVLMESAFLRRHWEWGGFKQGMRRVTLRGDLVAPLERRQPPYWFYNRFDNQLLVSSRHLREPCIEAIIDEIERFSPAVMQAYPSTAFALARFLKQRGRQLRIPVVFTASEPLHRHQRELIKQRFAARVMDMYGMAERVAFATECEEGSLHLNPDYSCVELVDEEGKPARDVGYIVGTTFHNLAMPLVRYRLSDRTRWVSGACRCGRRFPMIEPVTGKYEDYIYGSDGAFVSPSVLTFAFKGLQSIRQSQVAQVASGVWEVRVVPAPGFSGAEGARIVRNIHALVDPRVDVRVVVRTEIPCTAAGKFRWVVNESCQAGAPH